MDDSENCGRMPLFMVKKKAFSLYESGKRDLELRAVRPQWKNSKVGDIATIQCGRDILRKRIVKIHQGTLARILLKVNYKRIFPDAKTVFEAARSAKEYYPAEEEFMAFELKDID